MKVLFENDHGVVHEVIGLKLNGLTCLYDNESGEDRFFQAYFYVNERCLSVSVNDLCCDIYESDHDASLVDVEEDDCFSLRNYNDWVKDKTITQAIVSCEEKVRLIIRLSDGATIVMESDEDCKKSIERTIKV